MVTCLSFVIPSLLVACLSLFGPGASIGHLLSKTNPNTT